MICLKIRFKRVRINVKINFTINEFTIKKR